MTETYRKEIVQRVSRNLIDVQILRLVRAHPQLWGYMIKKTFDADFKVKLGHGVLYPSLKALEKRGFLASERRRERGRVRKVYKLTKEGERYLKSYYSVIREQLET